MLKNIVAFLLVLAVCATAFAVPAATVTGKITAITENKVTIELTSDKPDWVKKNGFVKFESGQGKILEVTGEAPVTITVKTKKAGDMKVGDAISFTKGKAMAGC